MDCSQLKPALREGARRLDQQNRPQPKVIFPRNPEASPSPSVIYCHQKDHLIGQRKRMSHKTPDLTPRRIRYDPVYSLPISEKISIPFDFTPFSPRQMR